MAQSQPEPRHLSPLPSQSLCCLYLHSAVTSRSRFGWGPEFILWKLSSWLHIFFLACCNHIIWYSMSILKSWWRKIAPFHRLGIIWLERERENNLPRSHTVSGWNGRSRDLLLGVLDWDSPLSLWRTCLPARKQIRIKVHFFFDENVKGIFVVVQSLSHV